VALSPRATAPTKYPVPSTQYQEGHSACVAHPARTSMLVVLFFLCPQTMALFVLLELLINLFAPGSSCRKVSHLTALLDNCEGFAELSFLALFFML
jgi:hypothetical protein